MNEKPTEEEIHANLKRGFVVDRLKELSDFLKKFGVRARRQEMENIIRLADNEVIFDEAKIVIKFDSKEDASVFYDKAHKDKDNLKKWKEHFRWMLPLREKEHGRTAYIHVGYEETTEEQP